MRRPFLSLLLVLIAIAGFSSGFAHLHAHAQARHEAFEAHIADVCTAATLRTLNQQAPGRTAAAATPGAPAPGAN
jgi:hypothetical protein